MNGVSGVNAISREQLLSADQKTGEPSGYGSPVSYMVLSESLQDFHKADNLVHNFLHDVLRRFLNKLPFSGSYIQRTELVAHYHTSVWVLSSRRTWDEKPRSVLVIGQTISRL